MVKESNKEIFMKKIAKTAIFLSILAVLTSCKTREKQVQKSETQSENGEMGERCRKRCGLC